MMTALFVVERYIMVQIISVLATHTMLDFILHAIIRFTSGQMQYTNENTDDWMVGIDGRRVHRSGVCCWTTTHWSHRKGLDMKYLVDIEYSPQTEGEVVLWRWTATIFNPNAALAGFPVGRVWGDTAYRDKDTAKRDAAATVKNYLTALVEEDNHETIVIEA